MFGASVGRRLDGIVGSDCKMDSSSKSSSLMS